MPKLSPGAPQFANERTFLQWIGVSRSLVTFGVLLIALVAQTGRQVTSSVGVAIGIAYTVSALVSVIYAAQMYCPLRSSVHERGHG